MLSKPNDMFISFDGEFLFRISLGGKFYNFFAVFNSKNSI